METIIGQETPAAERTKEQPQLAAKALREVTEMQDLAFALFMEQVHPILKFADPHTYEFLRHRMEVCTVYLHQALAKQEPKG